MKKLRLIKKCIKMMASGKTDNSNRLMKYFTLSDCYKFSNNKI